MSFETVCGILLIFFFLIFFLIFREISALVFLTSHLNLGLKVRGMWAERWDVCVRQLDPAFVCIIMY